MELYVSINFKFEHRDIQKLVTHAFEYLDPNSYLSHIAENDVERFENFKQFLKQMYREKLDMSLLDEYPHDYFTSVETFKINKGGSTTIEFMTGSSGHDFIKDLARFLKNHGAIKTNFKLDGLA